MSLSLTRLKFAKLIGDRRPHFREARHNSPAKCALIPQPCRFKLEPSFASMMPTHASSTSDRSTAVLGEDETS